MTDLRPQQPNDKPDSHSSDTGRESLLQTFKELSPVAERAVIAVFMASVTLEAVAGAVPDRIAPVLRFGATVLRMTGFSVGGIILTSASYYRASSYLRRKFPG